MYTENIRGAVENEKPSRPSSQPTNYPDELTTDKVVCFAHGFLPSKGETRDPTSYFERVFKALYWSGSNAKFCGIEWRSDQPATFPDYHMNVYNAFQSGSVLASSINNVFEKEHKYMIAHSLGNMLVSNAIKKGWLDVEKYFAFNAAVPAEAYGNIAGDIYDDEPVIPSYYVQGHNISRFMIQQDWLKSGMGGNTMPTLTDKFCYHPRSWASYHYMLFHKDDPQYNLTWNQYFSKITPKMINYFSPTEEVFRIRHDPFLTSGGIEVHSWQKQEMYKGCYYGQIPGTTSMTGWGFSFAIRKEDTPSGPQWEYRKQYAYESHNKSDLQLKQDPIFLHNPEDVLFTSNCTQDRIWEMLAKGIPALTPALGHINPNGMIGVDIYNDLIKNKSEWPRYDGDIKKKAWYHNDYFEMPYYHTKPLFDDLVGRGTLKKGNQK